MYFGNFPQMISPDSGIMCHICIHLYDNSIFFYFIRSLGRFLHYLKLDGHILYVCCLLMAAEFILTIIYEPFYNWFCSGETSNGFTLSTSSCSSLCFSFFTSLFICLKIFGYTTQGNIWRGIVHSKLVLLILRYIH